MIEVLWLDTQTDARWMTEEEFGKTKAPLATTVGYYFKTTDDEIKLSMAILPDGQRDGTDIPRGMVIQINELSVSTTHTAKRPSRSKTSTSAGNVSTSSEATGGSC